MAKKEMQGLAESALKQFGLLGVVVAHRLGPVPISEASVVIVTVSAHRKEALTACQVKRMWCLRSHICSCCSFRGGVTDSNACGISPASMISLFLLFFLDPSFQFLIDELKATVPIWKKEFYADGSIAPQWKANCEACGRKKSSDPHS